LSSTSPLSTAEQPAGLLLLLLLPLVLSGVCGVLFPLVQLHSDPEGHIQVVLLHPSPSFPPLPTVKGQQSSPWTDNMFCNIAEIER
jgi:hypothetical protein